MAMGVQGDRARTYVLVPFQQPNKTSRMYLRTGQHSAYLKDMNCQRSRRVVSVTLMIFAFCFQKPMNPIFIIYIPARTPSQIHFWRLQLLARYSWKTRVPWVFFNSSIHPPSVPVSIKARIRHSVTFYQRTLAPSILTAVQMSISSNQILIYFLRQASYSSYSFCSSYSFFYYCPSSSYCSSQSSSSSSIGSPEASKSLNTWVYLVALKQFSLILDQSLGILFVVFSFVVNRSKQESYSPSSAFLQFQNKIKLPYFSTWMFQGYCPPRTVKMASKNSMEHTTLFLMGSSLFIKSEAIQANPQSAKVLTLDTLQSLFSTKPVGFHDILYTFSLSLCILPVLLIQ